MTARFHSAALHRVAVPAWLLAIVIAAAIAASLLAVIDIAGDPAPVRADGGYQPQPTTCIDSSVVGHC
jgi:hypothetical protein